ncbi:MAG: hypothetical protein ABH952_00695 [Candidatus Omnitrophota bacterium]
MKQTKLILIEHVVVLVMALSLTVPQTVLAKGKGSSAGTAGQSEYSGKGRHSGWSDNTPKGPRYQKQNQVRQQEHIQEMTALHNKHKQEMKKIHNGYKEEIKNIQNKEEKEASRKQYQEEIQNRKRQYQQETEAKRNQYQEEMRQRQREYAEENEKE